MSASASNSQPTPQRPTPAGPTQALAARSGSAELSSLQQLADMDVDEDSLVVDQEAPTEKTDADFFNGTTHTRAHKTTLAARRLP